MYHGRHQAARRRRALLALPALGALAVTPVLIHPGDTMSSIAAAHHVQLGALEAANPKVVNPNLIYAGSYLNLPGSATVRAFTLTAPAPLSLGARLLGAAETRAGTPYVWGGTGPSGFDCSGLVFWAAEQLGISLPRTTQEMLGGSPHLQMVSSPEPGDLAFFGAGHVELYVKPGETFGALHGGTVVGFHPYGGWWVPTGFLRVVLPSKSRVAVRLRRMAPGRVMPGAIVLR